MYRGSRKHVLDWTGQFTFLHEFSQLLDLPAVNIRVDSLFMPRGVQVPEEARLERFGPRWLAGSTAWSCLQAWWLCHKKGANTPNWDVAIGCMIEDRPGLVLVEAKANWPELSKTGKPLRTNASPNSRANQIRIGDAISEARAGWRQVDSRINITIDSHYQLANRLAFSWKLASLGIPVVLQYLGFTGDDGIRNVGKPFADATDWQEAFAAYVSDVFPIDLTDKRMEVGSVPIWVVSRSRQIIEVSSVQ